MLRKISPPVQMLLLDSLDDDELDEYVLLHSLNHLPLRQKHTRGFKLDNLPHETCWTMFRFHKEDLLRLQQALQIGDFVTTPNNLVVPGTEALCVFLRRMVYPNRLADIAPIFRRCQADISYISSTILRHIYNLFHGKLETLNHQWMDCPRLAEAVQGKGAPLPNCIGFLDGTVRPICRPQQNQREVYNGHKRTHALKYQSLMLPNGIMGHVYGPVVGRRHDAALLAMSNLLAEVANCGDYVIYGDPAYPLREHLIVPFRGANVPEEQAAFNKDMSKVRASVEWGFGEVVRLFGFLDFKKNQRLLVQPIGKHYLVGCLLYNCHTCLYGSLTSSFFDCAPPTLEEYLA